MIRLHLFVNLSCMVRVISVFRIKYGQEVFNDPAVLLQDLHPVLLSLPLNVAHMGSVGFFFFSSAFIFCMKRQ